MSRKDECSDRKQTKVRGQRINQVYSLTSCQESSPSKEFTFEKSPKGKIITIHGLSVGITFGDRLVSGAKVLTGMYEPL